MFCVQIDGEGHVARNRVEVVLEGYFLLIDMLDGQLHAQHTCNVIGEGSCGIYNNVGRDSTGRTSISNAQAITGIFFNRRNITLRFLAASRANSFQHVLPKLLTADVAAATNVDDVSYFCCERRKLLLNLMLIVVDINIDVSWYICSEFRNIVLAGRKHIATARHVKYVIRVAGESIKFINAVIGEVRHGAMRPPISVVITRLRAGITHGLATIDEQYGFSLLLDAQVIGRGDSGKAGTDNRNFYILISHYVCRDMPFRKFVS